MTHLKEYKYFYKKRDKETKKIDQTDKSIPVSGTYIAELKKIYKDDVIKKGFKSYLVFENEKNLKKLYIKINYCIEDLNSKLQSWEPKYFLHKIKSSDGLPIWMPKCEPRKKFSTTKDFNPKSKFNVTARRLLKSSKL